MAQLVEGQASGENQEVEPKAGESQNQRGKQERDVKAELRVAQPCYLDGHRVQFLSRARGLGTLDQGRQESHGIYFDTVLPDLEMQVRTGGVSAVSHGTEVVAATYLLALFHQGLVKVTVKARNAASVVDLNNQTVLGRPADAGDNPVKHYGNLGAFGNRDVDTLVERHAR